MTSPTGTERPPSIKRLARDVVTATGAEAASFLHGQLSQDVMDLGAGDSRLSFLLQPQGKVDALIRITRLSEDSFLLDTDAGFGSAMTESLARFKLRTQVEFTESKWLVIAAFDANEDELARATGVEIVVKGLLGGSTDVDLIGPDPRIDNAVELTAEQYGRRRVEACFPLMGVDLGTDTIPNETGLLERAVSFTKGCYRGQELVERIHARGGNRQRLRRLDVGALVPAEGASVLDADREVGRVTSVSAGTPTLALAYVRGDVDQDSVLSVVWDDSDGRTRHAEAHVVGDPRS